MIAPAGQSRRCASVPGVLRPCCTLIKDEVLNPMLQN